MYTADRILSRNQNMFSGQSCEVISEERSKFSVKLRKSHRQDLVMKKRMKIFGDKTSRDGSLNNFATIVSTIKNCVLKISQNIESSTVVNTNLKILKKLFNNKRFFSLFWECDTFYLIKRIWTLHKELETIFLITEILIGLSIGQPKICLEMVNNGLIEKCFEYIDLNDIEILENCIWVLNNICISSEEISRILANGEYFNVLVALGMRNEIALNTKIIELFGNISKVCKGSWNHSQVLIEIFSMYFKIEKLKLFCIIGFSRISYYCYENLKEVFRVNPDIVMNLVEINEYENELLIINAIKLLGNFALEDDTIELLIDNGVLPFLLRVIQNSHVNVRNEGFFIFSNLLTTKETNLLRIIAHKALISKLFEGTQEYSYTTRIEVWHCIGSLTRFYPYLSKDFYGTLIFNMNLSFKNESDPKILKLMLTSYENLLKYSQSLRSEVKSVLESSQCFDSMILKRHHANSDISELVEKIIDDYYDRDKLCGLESDEEDFQ